jgi:hypothetical protein
LAVKLTSMMEEFEENENKRIKKVLASIKRFHSA